MLRSKTGLLLATAVFTVVYVLALVLEESNKLTHPAYIFKDGLVIATTFKDDEILTAEKVEISDSPHLNPRKGNNNETVVVDEAIAAHIAALPKWLQKYLKWHAIKRSAYNSNQQRNDSVTIANNQQPIQDNTKFLVLSCFAKSQKCGGLSDRLRSIPYFLKIAKATNRVFLIKWDPNDLEKFLVPPIGGLDWTVPRHWDADFYSRNSCITKEINKRWRPGVSEKQRANELQSSEKVVCLYSQGDLYTEVKQDFATKAQPYGTYSDTFRTLFQPSTALAAQIDNIMVDLLGDSLQGNIYIAAQIRSSYPFLDENAPKEKKGLIRPNLKDYPNEVKGWADNAVRSVITEYEKYLMSTNATMIPASQKILHVYVTSDKPELVQYLKFQSPLANVSTTTFPSINIIGLESMPRPSVGAKEEVADATDLFPAFIDLFILGGSSCVAFGMGGYGRFGSRLAGEQCSVQHRMHGWHL
jgi:hypothetical protein